jgi:hypothetical protein
MTSSRGSSVHPELPSPAILGQVWQRVNRGAERPTVEGPARRAGRRALSDAQSLRLLDMNSCSTYQNISATDAKSSSAAATWLSSE